jgi:hypothetical protein
LSLSLCKSAYSDSVPYMYTMNTTINFFHYLLRTQEYTLNITSCFPYISIEDFSVVTVKVVIF